MTAPRYTISILCLNRLDLTMLCIASVLKHTRDFELIVTNNGSSDGTPEYLTRLKAQLGDTLRVITNAENRGFKDPNNHALTLAQGEFFVLLNNDMEVCEGWLEALTAPFDADPKLAITGIANTCTTISKDLRGVPAPGKPPEYIEGSCLVTLTALARKHGLFPSYLDFIYWEDTAYALRMRELGYTIRVVDLPMHHKKRSSTIKQALPPERINELLERNKAAMVQRWGFYFRRRDIARRILVRRLGAHGDVLLATPALRALRERYPLAAIDIVTKCPSMLAGFDDVRLAEERRSWYDEFVDLDLAYEKRPEVHIVTAFADALDVKLPTWWRLHMQASDADARWAQRVTRGARVALLHPGVSCWPGKNWPVDRWQSVAAELLKRGYFTITVGDATTPRLPTHLHLAGETTPQQLYAICQHASLFVGIDSMPQHVASAADTPSVVLFGPTNPRVIQRPAPHIVPVQADVRVVPCVGEHGRRTKPVTQAPCDGACMRAISVEDVLKRVERVERLVR